MHVFTALEPQVSEPLVASLRCLSLLPLQTVVEHFGNLIAKIVHQREKVRIGRDLVGRDAHRPETQQLAAEQQGCHILIDGGIRFQKQPLLQSHGPALGHGVAVGYSPVIPAAFVDIGEPAIQRGDFPDVILIGNAFQEDQPIEVERLPNQVDDLVPRLGGCVESGR